ncbi:cation-transporting P-type ATPase [Amycolatopsis sp. NPDC051128]|uniref:cation-transporting P-type ATPase n=1 Tax=Amycolatopsis sp. NPDC051128 TaxID=3155412 RepID=UPI00342B6E79
MSGPNALPSRGGPKWPLALLRQFVHPLALLLGVAGGLAWVAGTTNLAIAIAGVILLNGLLAFFQEQQAEKAVEALGKFLPDRAPVLRDGHVWHAPASWCLATCCRFQPRVRRPTTPENGRSNAGFRPA